MVKFTAQYQTEILNGGVRLSVPEAPNSSSTAFDEFRMFENETFGPIKAAGSIPTVYIVGDSTVQTYDSSRAPQQGWGYYLPNYFTPAVSFINKAIGGRSSKTFIEEDRLNEILRDIKANDYLFVQMGHNDATSSKPERHTVASTSYKHYLQMYIDSAQERGAIPILITPVCRLDYRNGNFINNFPDYCTAMKQVAIANNMPCIDLMTGSLNLLTAVGYNTAYTYYMVSVNDTDYTHLTAAGADQMAKLVAQGIREIKVGISRYAK
ncbi:MAG TPA: rhamnogalacturonan acetylesterase [Bacillota bacterium]|nr:rhamnogalacturonan acetylesterase [Bacillota bacterium]